jgi:hypothetical protein
MMLMTFLLFLPPHTFVVATVLVLELDVDY